MTIVINRGAKASAKQTPTRPSALSRAALAMARNSAQSAKRNPKYIDPYSAEGLQVAISATGGASQTIYADISGSSPLCTTASEVTTCNLSIPTLGANEQFTILEVDETPNAESNGYGTGFPTESSILGSVQQASTITLGTQNNVAIVIGPVAAYVYDESDEFTIPFGMPKQYTAAFGVDRSGVDDNRLARIVVTAGVNVTGTITPQFENADYDECDFSTTTGTFADVNGAAAPITLTANGSGVTLAPVINNGSAPTAASYASTASIPNDSYYWEECFFLVGVNVASTVSSQQTVTLANNLTATPAYSQSRSPNSSAPYTDSYAYTVVPISSSSYSVSIPASGSASVIGNDYGASYGMDATFAYDQYDYTCQSGGTTLATITTGSINTTTWQQSFTITAGATTGTCTFYLVDDWTAAQTQPITVTIH